MSTIRLLGLLGIAAFLVGGACQADPPARREAARAHIEEGLAARGRGELADALAHFNEALKASPDDEEALSHRGFVLQLEGKRKEAEADLRRASALAQKRWGAAHDFKKGQRVVAVASCWYYRKSAYNTTQPGDEFVVHTPFEHYISVVDESDKTKTALLIQKDYFALAARQASDSRAVLREGECWSALAEGFRSASHLRVHFSVPTAARPGSGAVTVYVDAHGEGRPSEASPAKKCFVSTVRSRDTMRRLAGLLCLYSDSLVHRAQWKSGASRELRLFFSPPRPEYLPAAGGLHLYLSPRAQRHWRVTKRWGGGAGPSAVLVKEPHWYYDEQLNLYQGLDHLVRDNPLLRERGAMSFLAEGWPAGKAVPLAPLLEAEKKPDEALVRKALRTFLVPAYVAYEWKHQHGTPISGNEDGELHRLCMKLVSEHRNGRFTGDASARRYQFAGEVVQARNEASANSLLEALKKVKCPLLFIGREHVGPTWEVVGAPAVSKEGWERYKGFAPDALLKKVRKAARLGIANYLQEKKVGYVLLEPAEGPYFPARERTEDYQFYNRLMTAQVGGTEARYIDALVPPKKETTVSPSPEWAGLAIVAMRKRGGGRAAPPLSNTKAGLKADLARVVNVLPTSARDVPADLSLLKPGAKLGEGGNKVVFAVEGRDDLAIGVLKAGANREALDRELKLLDRLQSLGLPAVQAYGTTTVGGRPAVVMDRYAEGSKDVVKLEKGKVRGVGESKFLNERSVQDLLAIRRQMVERMVSINDLQFLIARDGRVVVADPLGVTADKAPSKNNLSTINKLIEAARKSKGGK